MHTSIFSKFQLWGWWVMGIMIQLMTYENIFAIETLSIRKYRDLPQIWETNMIIFLKLCLPTLPWLLFLSFLIHWTSLYTCYIQPYIYILCLSSGYEFSMPDANFFELEKQEIVMHWVFIVFSFLIYRKYSFMLCWKLFAAAMFFNFSCSNLVLSSLEV